MRLTTPADALKVADVIFRFGEISHQTAFTVSLCRSLGLHCFNCTDARGSHACSTSSLSRRDYSQSEELWCVFLCMNVASPPEVDQLNVLVELRVIRIGAVLVIMEQKEVGQCI